MYSEPTFQELYWAIEDLLYEMELTMSDDQLAYDTEYLYCCNLLNCYDGGDRSIKLFNEMRCFYVLAS